MDCHRTFSLRPFSSSVDASAGLFRPWQVDRRQLLAAPSRERIVCRLSLVPVDGMWPEWEAGDEAETRPIALRCDRALQASEFRYGLPVAPYAAAALLPEGHPAGRSIPACRGDANTWRIASLRRDGTLDLLLVSERSSGAAQIPQYLLTDLEIDLRIRPQSLRHPPHNRDRY